MDDVSLHYSVFLDNIAVNAVIRSEYLNFTSFLKFIEDTIKTIGLDS